MTDTSIQPPPVLVPVDMKKSQPSAAYLDAQKDAVYQMWTELQRLAGLNPPGTDFVDAVNSPVALDIARFTDSNSIEGLSYAEFKRAIFPYAAKTSAYTVTESDYLINCTGTFTVTLLSAVGGEGQPFIIRNAGTGVITVDGDGTETINGSLTQTLNQYDSIKISSDGANWMII